MAAISNQPLARSQARLTPPAGKNAERAGFMQDNVSARSVQLERDRHRSRIVLSRSDGGATSLSRESFKTYVGLKPG